MQKSALIYLADDILQAYSAGLRIVLWTGSILCILVLICVWIFLPRRRPPDAPPTTE